MNAIIVDDEPFCCEALAGLLTRYCPAVTISAICNSGAEGLVAIKQHQPQLLFLDIEMNQMSGFNLLEQLPEIKFELIFTTSYDQYAIKAIRFSAMDYLLKPIDREELQLAVQKAQKRLQKHVPQQLEILLQKIYKTNRVMQRIALPTMEGLQMVPVDSIIRCEADNNYTFFFLKGNQRLVVSRTLKETEEMLEEYNFIRAHNSYLVNINEINKYMKGEGGYLVMSDGSIVDVSRSKKEMLLRKLAPYKE